MANPTVHASAVLAGSRAVLIRGAAGSGKSRLALALIEAAEAGALRFARLVADDRAELQASHGRLLVAPPPALAGMIEVRGLGIRRLPFEPVAVVGMIVDLDAGDAARMAGPSAEETEVEGIRLPRIPVSAGINARPIILAALRTDPI
jgi:serine kinase of HPr protein (carbohydrate metabolism regulator)